VAVTEIKEREIITPEMLETKNVRGKDRDILSPKAAKDPNELIGTLSKKKISAGKVIDTVTDVVKISPPQVEDGGNSSQVTEVSESILLKSTERLISVKLESESALNNMLRKGDFVDVVGTYEDKDDTKLTLIVAQHVEVQDVAEMLEDEKGKESQNVILRLDMKQATDIVWLKSNGKIDLLLSSAQAKKEEAGPITEDTVFNRSLGALN
jgi:Flp pilus assembly protein CpaB